jgi:multiple antibiotic resistance protein
VFLTLAEELSRKDQWQLSKHAITIGAALLVIFAVGGELLLAFFQITVDYLMVAGGILLLILALEMVLGRKPRTKTTPEEIEDSKGRDDVAVFPLATPLLTGPGAITTVIVLMRTSTILFEKAFVIISIILTFVIALILYRFSGKLYKVMGVTGLMVLGRIMGIFIAAIAVKFLAVGIWNIYTSFV